MKPLLPTRLFICAAALLAGPLLAQEVAATPPIRPAVSFSVIKTSKVDVVERLLVPNGSYTKKIATNFSAFLIKHNQDTILLDTGLGGKIEDQYEQDMTWWQRPFFKFERPVVSARQQLQDAGYAPIKQVIVSHSHWDHAGGVQDFPEAKILVSGKEMDVIAHPTTGAGGTWASQVADKSIQWSPVDFTSGPYKGYESSLDLFKDGSVVLVPMPGHTEGSIGVFVTVESGKCYFFIGDVAWKVAALQAGSPKFWAASMIVDHDREQTLASVKQVQAVMQRYPDLVVVPAHDGAVQDALGYFPNFVQ